MTPSFPTRRASDLLTTARRRLQRQLQQCWPRPLGRAKPRATTRSTRHPKKRRAASRSTPRTSSTKRLHVTTRTLTARARSEEHTSELQSLMRISYDVFCLKKKKNRNTQNKY